MVRPVSLLVCGALVTGTGFLFCSTGLLSIPVALISLRIYALYNRSRAILGMMFFSALVVLSVASVSKEYLTVSRPTQSCSSGRFGLITASMVPSETPELRVALNPREVRINPFPW